MGDGGHPRRADPAGDGLERWVGGTVAVSRRWEEAYRRFETKAEERAKFERRLVRVGARAWPRDSRIAELFCGSGVGLEGLARMGFTSLLGVDLSVDLLSHHDGPARLVVGDCRRLDLDDGCLDVVIVQGGLHHLERLPEDLQQTLSEVVRVLTTEGRLVVVEPWLTPFLRVVHRCLRSRLLRRTWPRLDALAVMVEEEGDTYERWLARPEAIRELLHQHFEPRLERAAWGKLTFVGAPRR